MKALTNQERERVARLNEVWQFLFDQEAYGLASHVGYEISVLRGLINGV